MNWKKGDIVDFKVYHGNTDDDAYTLVGEITVVPSDITWNITEDLYEVVVVGGEVETEIGAFYILSDEELLPHNYQSTPKPQEPFWVCETREDMHKLIEDVMDYYKRFHDQCSEHALVSSCLESFFAKSEER